MADAKYGTTGNFLYLSQPGIPAVIPTTRFGNMRNDIWGREHKLPLGARYWTRLVLLTFGCRFNFSCAGQR